jgi:hypothetical protein
VRALRVRPAGESLPRDEPLRVGNGLDPLGGKTDVLIRFEDLNLFIAECKFWEGARAFSEAIDQLFGLTSWQHTKLTLIVFVREKGLTAIIERGDECWPPQGAQSKGSRKRRRARSGAGSSSVLGGLATRSQCRR